MQTRYHKLKELFQNSGIKEIYDNSAVPTTHERGILGDATKETLKTFGLYPGGGWYGNNTRFPSTVYPWFCRGGRMYTSHSTNPGIFDFTLDSGDADPGKSSRGVLVLE